MKASQLNVFRTVLFLFGGRYWSERQRGVSNTFQLVFQLTSLLLLSIFAFNAWCSESSCGYHKEGWHPDCGGINQTPCCIHTGDEAACFICFWKKPIYDLLCENGLTVYHNRGNEVSVEGWCRTPYDQSPRGKAWLFGDADYNGHFAELAVDDCCCRSCTVGKWNCFGIGCNINGKVSSAKVGPGTYITLYTNPNFSGEATAIFGNVPRLATYNPPYDDKAASGVIASCSKAPASDWTKKPIDNSRGTQCNNGVDCGRRNCWECDDAVRDGLDMTSTKLNFVSELKEGFEQLKDGRYIYVFRGHDNKFILRRYDRTDTCRDYSQYQFSDNKRGSRYLHVRHSQLNGGWTPVWAAGELRIKDHKLYRINNESGHFKPSISNVKYAVEILCGIGVPFHEEFLWGDFEQVSASECKGECVDGNCTGYHRDNR